MSLRRSSLVLVLGILLFSPGATTSSRAEQIAIGGTGSATAFLRQLGPAFAARTGIQLDVLASMGSTGALRATGEGALDIAVSGRPLKQEEIQKGLRVAHTLTTPFVFVTSLRTAPHMSVADIARAYSDAKATWPDGSPIHVILRPASESDTQLMATLFPGLGAAQDGARQRSDIPVAATDQDNADVAERTPASLTAMTYLQVVAEKRDLRFVAIDGVEPTLQNFERGAYTYAKDLVFVVPAQSKPAINAFLEFLRSPEAAEQFRRVQMY
jgi:phosphate transport system substrate-binding protein